MNRVADEAFHGFVTQRADELRRLARLLVADPDSADDLVQSCLLRVWTYWPRVSRAEAPWVYVRKTMVNLAISNAERAGRSPRNRLPDSPDRDEAQKVVDHQYLISALRQLPPRQRSAVVLRYYCDLHDAAIADVLTCNVSTVRSQIHRALKHMRVDAELGSATPVHRALSQPHEEGPT